MADLILHQINGVSIGLRKTDGYINATKACLAYNSQTGKAKQPSDWLKTKKAKAYISYVSSVTTIVRTELLIVKKGGDPAEQGTWLHPKLATSFSSWLSEEFEYFVSEWLQEWSQGKLTNTFPGELTGPVLLSPIEQGVRDIKAIMGAILSGNSMLDSITAEAIACQYPEYRPAIEAAKNHLLLPTKSQLITPKQLGTKLSPQISAQKVNKLLIACGLQKKTGEKQCPYVAIGRGLDHAELVANTARGHAKTVQQLRWYESVLELIS